MSGRYYRLCAIFAASLSSALVGCRSAPPPIPEGAGTQAASPAPAPAPQRTASNAPREIDTDATIWTFLHIRKEAKANPTGPHVGPNVSPVLWVAAHNTLDFVKTTSEDPLLGRMVTDWYSPPDKPDERFRVNVDVLARTLRSDAIAVRVERQTRSPDGGWQDASVDRKLADDLTFAILNRAREIRAAVMEARKQ